MSKHDSGSTSTGAKEPAIDQKPRRNSKASGSGNPDAADQLLENLGYKAELSRNRSTFQVAFMSFVLASIPYGLATTLAYPLIGGGPVNVIWGWLAVSLIIVCVAASLGEITSVYPTAGGTIPSLQLSLARSRARSETDSSRYVHCKHVAD
jgi:amino acid permease